MRSSYQGGIRAVLILVSLIWGGMLIGVSFLATPVKFAAPSLTLPVALDVGRHTFGVFNVVEVILAIGTAALAALYRHRLILALVAVAAGAVVVQTLWLLPILDARVGVILAGGDVPSSSLHLVYIALDMVKFLALLTIGGGLLFSGHERPSHVHIPEHGPAGMRLPVSTGGAEEREEGLCGGVFGGVVGLAVGPRAPEDARPGSGEDADRVGV